MSLVRSSCRLRHQPVSLPLRLAQPSSHNYATQPPPPPPTSSSSTSWTTESNPVLDKVRARQARLEEVERNTRGTDVLVRGSLAPSSLFNSSVANPPPTITGRGQAMGMPIPPARVHALDPMPHRRRLWERKMVIRSVRRRGRLSKAQIIKRTEREFVSRSDFWRTSMKKLNPLANQIAGKPIEEAIVQMQYSKKKAAADIKKHLELAWDKAVVERGMGLGKAQGNTGERTVIRYKDGTRKVIEDRTGIYVDQAWVSKGLYGSDANPRARGRIDRLRLPQTAITVLLKEEATRVRQHKERKEKENNKKIWTQLPNRPITTQRQYFCW